MLRVERSQYLFLRHFQGLEVVADDTQFFLELHDFPVIENTNEIISVWKRNHQDEGSRAGKA